MALNEQRTVLVVDDDPAILEMMRLLCESLSDVTCLTASSLDEIKKLRWQLPQIRTVILDVNLGPNQPSGVDVYHWLRENRFSEEVVFFSGHGATHPLVADALRTPGTSFVAKPVDVDRLISIVEGAAA